MPTVVYTERYRGKTRFGPEQTACANAQEVGNVEGAYRDHFIAQHPVYGLGRRDGATVLQNADGSLEATIEVRYP